MSRTYDKKEVDCELLEPIESATITIDTTTCTYKVQLIVPQELWSIVTTGRGHHCRGQKEHAKDPKSLLSLSGSW